MARAIATGVRGPLVVRAMLIAVVVTALAIAAAGLHRSATPADRSPGPLRAGKVAGHDFCAQEVADGCVAALERHGVVIYREANISDADLVAFSRMLGQVVIAPMGNHEVYPENSRRLMHRTTLVGEEGMADPSPA